MQNILITGPATEPVSTDEAKAFLRFINHDTEDTFIAELIQAAREFFEEKTQLALINQTWRLTLDDIPSKPSKDSWWDGVREGAIAMLSEPQRFIELPKSPLSSVTTFTAYAEDDTGTAFSDFYADTGRRPGRIALRNGSVWPSATRGVANYVIDYVAGFGASADEVPVDIKIAIKQIVSHWYENREILSFDAAGRDVPMGAHNIIKQRKVMKI